MSDRLYQLANKPVGRLLWQYSLPGVVGMLVQALYNVVDRIFIGQWCGPDAIAGLTVTFPLMNIATAVGVLVGVGSCSRISIVLGKGDLSTAERYLGNALTLTVLNAAIYISVFALLMEPLLRTFGASDATLPIAAEYMFWLLPGMMLINVAFSLNNVMRASGYPRRAMATMIIGAAVNVVLDPIFIKVFDMGIVGAALATDIAMGVSAVFVLAHFCRRDSTLRFRRRTYRLNKTIVLGIFSIGAAPALVNAAACGINAIVNTSLAAYAPEGLADTAIAAAGIFVTFTSLAVTVVLGICQGLQPIVGYNYGAGLTHRLKRTYLLAVTVATALTATASVVGLVAPQYVAMAFTTDASLIDFTCFAIRHSVWAFAVVGFQIISTSLFQSIGKAGKSIFLGLVRQVIFMVPLLLVLPRMAGVAGVWLSFPVSDVLATVITVAMVWRQLRELGRPRLEAVPA